MLIVRQQLQIGTVQNPLVITQLHFTQIYYLCLSGSLTIEGMRNHDYEEHEDYENHR